MSQDVERRLTAAFHDGALPAAPRSLVDRLEQITSGTVPHRSRSGRRTIAGLLVAAAILLAGGALALSVGSTPDQGLVSPTSMPSPTPVPSPSGLSGLQIDLKVAGLTPSDAARISSILEERVAATGVVGGVVEQTGEDGFRIILPAVTATDGRIVDAITATGRVDIVPTGDRSVSVGARLDLSSQPPIVGGPDIQSIEIGSDPQTGGRTLQIVLSPDAAATFAEYTTNAIGTFMALTLDGTAVVVPVINDAIVDGDIEITLATSPESPADAGLIEGFVAVVKSGVLPVPVEVTGVQVIALESPRPSD